jgi:threonine dehydrogenase-like Zn-dependent dehydrogenase
MRAVVLDTPGYLRALDLPEPHDPGPDQALIRIRKVGVCGTDYHAFNGNQPFFTYPRILGHELGVEVVALGSGVRGLSVGDKCALRPYLNCGRCPACLRGKPNCCPNIQVFGVHIDGGMRDYALVPASHLHPARSLNFEQLALVEPLSIGAHAIARAQIARGERTFVIGVGPIGLAVTQFALLAGAQVTVMDISEQRLAFCRQLWPVLTCLNGRNLASDEIEQFFGEDLPTAVFEATGNAQSMQSAFSYVGYGGRLIYVGLVAGDVTFPDPLFHSREITLLGSRNALAEDFTAIITAVESASLDLSPWITHRTTLDSLIEVFPQWLKPGNGLIKGIVSLDD